ETVVPAKQIGQQLAIVACTDLLERPPIHLRSFSLENRVRRHHASDVRGESAEEWLDVQVEIAAREIRESPVARMAVEAVLLRAVSDPVLDDRDHTGGVDARSPVLKSFDVSLHQRAREIDVFSESAADATPA